MTTTANTDLTKYWTRYDFRESMFAPGFAILQALSHSGKTASGTGDTREEALERCLSETAEILAIEHRAKRESMSRARLAFDGLAAHTDSAIAQRTALLEAHERAAVMAWWYGDLQSHQLPDEWMLRSGILPWINQMRQKATSRRQTQLWSLEGWGPVQVVISKSTNGTGQDPILGFGASDTLEKAARKAVRETLEMELNLVEIMAVRSGYLDFEVGWIEDKIALYSARCPQLLEPNVPVASVHNPTQGKNFVVRFDELTVPGQRPVWGCIFDDETLRKSSKTTPFMSKMN